MTTEPITYLYRCFDRDGQLLYVGVTDNVERRKREHAKDKFWWHDVARVTRMAFQRRIEALWAEWAVISTCGPIYNCSATIPVVPNEHADEPDIRPATQLRPSSDVAGTLLKIKRAHPNWANTMPSARSCAAVLGVSPSTGLSYQKRLIAELAREENVS